MHHCLVITNFHCFCVQAELSSTYDIIVRVSEEKMTRNRYIWKCDNHQRVARRLLTHYFHDFPIYLMLFGLNLKISFLVEWVIQTNIRPSRCVIWTRICISIHFTAHSVWNRNTEVSSSYIYHTYSGCNMTDFYGHHTTYKVLSKYLVKMVGSQWP